ncbi:condensation domain-containing protein [Microbulbifer sp. OS29]|uniref:Condensation domain-containing protein n=1 Tax=Microbulbifer okhotskensis TaxID=2926617 RepID=A0A9X2EMG8_9GAMM|nr:condensation domain-containing protein [Microbulbifer okhotskensis]MCO1334952.1 condensation domain-containing protein [Microbulbifer okhotskensis]
MPGWSLSTHVPLSVTEQRIYDLNRRKVLADLIARAMVVKGRMDVSLFEQAIPGVVNRYPTFRCRYHGEPVTRAFRDIELDYMDIRHMSTERITGFLRQFSSSPMDLSEDQLLGLSLLRTAEDEYIFLTKCHHIITDGMSLSLLWAEALTSYLTEEVGKSHQPRVESMDFADYVHFENHYLDSVRGQKAQSYWREKLASQARRVEQVQQKEIVSITCSEVNRNIDETIFIEIKARASSAKVSLFAYLAAAFQQIGLG